jgi:hypothetical protein
MAAAFGTVGFCWRGLPERIHPALPAIGLVVCVLSYLAIPMLTRDGALACSRPPCRRGDAEAERLTRDAEPVSRIGRCGLRRPGGHNGGYDSMAG